MKRKNSYSATEASFDTLMANTSECNTSKKVNFEGGSSPNSSLIKRAQFDLIRSEQNEESDNESNELDSKNDVTTLRMLFDKVRTPDIDFYDACLEIGLLNSSNGTCLVCNIDSILIETDSNVDRLIQQCHNCNSEWSIRRDSWVEEIDISLKESILIIYCWCKNYPLNLTLHEIGTDRDVISEIFDKCSGVADIYFQNQLSNIGGPDKTVVADIFTYNDRSILGCFESDTKNTFYTLLSGGYDRNLILTLLIDNLSKGTKLFSKENSQLSKVVDKECVSFLKESWDIDFKMESALSTECLILRWTEFDHLLPPADNLNPAYSGTNADSILQSALFRDRMDNSHDSFLFFLAVVSTLFNNGDFET